MLLVLKDTSFEHPKRMFKLMGKKIHFYAQIDLLPGPMKLENK